MLVELVLSLSLLAAFWIGHHKSGGFVELNSKFSQRLIELQKTREKYDGIHR